MTREASKMFIERKFRAWDKRERKMLSPEDLEAGNYALGSNGKIVVMDADSSEAGHLWLCDWMVPMMATGSLDANGREIYEGDITATAQQEDIEGLDTWDEEVIGVVEWVEEHALFSNLPSHEGEDSMYSSMFAYVKGNVFENPELLEKI